MWMIKGQVCLLCHRERRLVGFPHFEVVGRRPATLMPARHNAFEHFLVDKYAAKYANKANDLCEIRTSALSSLLT